MYPGILLAICYTLLRKSQAQRQINSRSEAHVIKNQLEIRW
jgi:hypothetical protein